MLQPPQILIDQSFGVRLIYYGRTTLADLQPVVPHLRFAEFRIGLNAVECGADIGVAKRMGLFAVGSNMGGSSVTRSGTKDHIGFPVFSLCVRLVAQAYTENPRFVKRIERVF